MIMAVCATSQRNVPSVSLLIRLRVRSVSVPGTFARFRADSFVCDEPTAAAESMAKNDLLCIGSLLLTKTIIGDGRSHRTRSAEHRRQPPMKTTDASRPNDGA